MNRHMAYDQSKKRGPYRPLEINQSDTSNFNIVTIAVGASDHCSHHL